MLNFQSVFMCGIMTSFGRPTTPCLVLMKSAASLASDPQGEQWEHYKLGVDEGDAEMHRVIRLLCRVSTIGPLNASNPREMKWGPGGLYIPGSIVFICDCSIVL